MSGQSCKLFLGGLNYNTVEDGLKEYFSKYGRVVDCVVMRFHDSKRSRGFGFVTFSNQDEADYCFEDAPHVIDDSTIETKRATPKDEIDKDSKVSGEILRKLFVGGLNFATTDSGLKLYFEQFGEVDDCFIMKFRDTRKSRGFGFVTFKSPEMVDEVQKNRPHRIDDTKIETRRATPREETKGDSGVSVKRIFVGGLRDQIEDQDLEDYFSTFGRVISVEQMVEKGTNKRRGFGFVEFDDYDPVDKILLQPLHTIGGWKIDIKKALSRSDISLQTRGGRDDGDDRFGRNFSQSQAPAPWSRNQQSGFGNQGFGNQGFGSHVFGGQGPNRQGNSGPWDNNYGGPSPWQSSSGSWEDQGNFGSGGRWGGNNGGGNGGQGFGPIRGGPMGGNSGRSAPYSVGGSGRGRRW